MTNSTAPRANTAIFAAAEPSRWVATCRMFQSVHSDVCCMARTYVAIPPRVSVLVDTHSARRSAMLVGARFGDDAARRLCPLMAIGPADRDSGEQKGSGRREVEEPEVDGQPAAEQDGDRR